MKAVKILFITIALASVSLTINAKNYYVAVNGSGSGTISSPYGTIAQAANQASAGDTVFIAGGVYSEMSIKPKNSGSQAKGFIVFCSWPNTGRVVLTKNNNVSSDESNAIFDLADRSYIWLEDMNFQNMTYVQSCVSLARASNCVVTGCKFKKIGIEEIAEAWGGGSMLWMNGSQDCVVSNCYFNTITGDAVGFVGQSTKRNLFCGNTFVNLKGKKRSWDTGGYKFSSGITGSDTSFGDNLLCFNHFTGGQDAIWLDRDGSSNIIVRNFGNGCQRLVFNESRCARNWIQENVAINMQEAGYRSALYDGTNWSFDSRYINNVAYNCKYGIYLHKSKHNEVRNNIIYNSTNYNLIMTDSAFHYGSNYFRNNLWRSTSKTTSIQYKGKDVTPYSFGSSIGETGGIYYKSPAFIGTNAEPSSYMLQTSSPCIGAGDGGIDMGAYPLYSFSDMGCNTLRSSSQIQPYFENIVTEVLRGEQFDINVRLVKAASEPVNIKLIPVAGDAQENVDYILSDNNVTFQPGETSKSVSISFVGEESNFGKLLLLRLCDENFVPYNARSYTAFKLITREEHDALLNTDLYLEAENSTIGSLWQLSNDSKASGGKYVTIKSGNNSNNNAPTESNGLIGIDFEISRPTTYVLWLRTICPSANDDSFWLRIDNEEWSSWNGIPISSSWQWNQCPRTYTMLEGKHTLYIGYREDGAKLDKLMFSCIGTEPEGMGSDVTSVSTIEKFPSEIVDISYYDMTGRKLPTKPSCGITIKRIQYKDGTVKCEKCMLIK